MPADDFLYCVWRFIFSPTKGIDSRLEMKTFAGQTNFPTLELWVSAHSSPRGSAQFCQKQLCSPICQGSEAHPALFLSLWKHLPVLQLQGFTRAEFRSTRLTAGISFSCLQTSDSRTAWHVGLFIPRGSLGGGGHSPHSALSELKYQWTRDTGNGSQVSHQKFYTTRWQPGNQVAKDRLFRCLLGCWCSFSEQAPALF